MGTSALAAAAFLLYRAYIMAGDQQVNIWTAASDGDLERVKHLVENEGFSPNVKDNNGYTPIHAAVSWNHPTLLRYLLSRGGSINVADSDGDTPLFTVESLDTCKLVLELGGDPHLMNEAGQTAAQSLFEEHPEISEFLCTLTGGTLPASGSADDGDTSGNVGDASSVSDAAAAMSIVDTINAQPPEDIDSLDPVSRQAAIETNNRAGTLLSRVQAILIECDESGEDPEPRIRAVVDETVRNTMEAGRQLAETQEEGAAAAAAASASAAEDSPEKRQRTQEDL